mmetsp:Transcript_6585/g.15422  ORF Transcript_6585/g.15422 Transcript_6585/m.15422 type:complete len:120 (-) Transcript_6585:348-707(-)
MVPLREILNPVPYGTQIRRQFIPVHQISTSQQCIPTLAPEALHDRRQQSRRQHGLMSDIGRELNVLILLMEFQEVRNTLEHRVTDLGRQQLIAAAINAHTSNTGAVRKGQNDCLDHRYN